MIKVTNLEEKKKILAHFLVRQRKTESIEAVCRQYCMWWEKDFTSKDGIMKMYNHSFVLSKKKRKAGIEAPEYCQDYYVLLEDVFAYVRDSYDKETIYLECV